MPLDTLSSGSPAIIIILIGLVFVLIGRHGSRRFRNFTGNFLHAGDIKAPVSQSYSPSSPPAQETAARNYVSWIIGILGLILSLAGTLLAAWGFYLDHFA